MGTVIRRIKIGTANLLRQLAAGVKGRGTSSLHEVKKVRKALEAATTDPGGRPAYFEDDEGNGQVFGIDPNWPLFMCPECGIGQVAVNRETKEIDECTNRACKFKDADFDPDWDEIAGYKRLRIDGKIVKYCLLKIPKRFIAGTIWTKILLPKLEEEHTVLHEDQIEMICKDFRKDGLLTQFENVTIPEEKEEAEDSENAPEGDSGEKPEESVEEGAENPVERELADDRPQIEAVRD